MSAKPRIERAALAVFIRDGVDGATTKAIAAAAAVSEGALYRHFRSKDEMALSLFMDAHRRLTTLVEAAAATGGDVRQKAAAIVHAYCQAADEDWTLFTYHLLSLHRFLPYYQEDGRDPVTAVEKVVKRAMMDAQIPPGDPRVIAAMAIGLISQVAQNKAYHRLEEPMSAHLPLMTAAVQAVLFAR